MNRNVILIAAALFIFFIPIDSLTAAQTPEQLAQDIITATGLSGGLIVHVGCGDGQLTAALRASDSYLVHGIDTNPANITAARAHIRSQGLYGPVTAELYSGASLPYIENLVNLLVSESPLAFDSNEILRVLAPKGIAYIHDGNDWTITQKPRPSEMDEWTHYLHDATNNAVSNDDLVAPLHRFQWQGSPRWSRHHDRMASMSACVISNGRMFYIFDEGSKNSVQLPSSWALYARDAFNGTILWKKPIASWMTQLWPFKSGPALLPRRLVAAGDKVYVTLGLDKTPLSQLDAVTGNVLQTYAGTNMTEEVLYSEGTLFITIKNNPNETTWNDFKPIYRVAKDGKGRVDSDWPWDENDRLVTAIDPNSGAILWQKTYSAAPMSLTVDSNSVYFHDGNGIIALNRTNGNERWQSVAIPRDNSMGPKFGTTLVARDGFIFFEGGDSGKNLTALSAATGQLLWQDGHPATGHNCPYDMFYIDNKAWVGAVAGSSHSGIFTGWDPNSGAILNEFPPDVETHWFHHRCYRAKATDNYILTSRTGIEFIDYKTETWTIHHWVRGGCLYGIIPANGLIYTPAHDCGCYFESKLFGFCSLAPAHTNPNYPQAPSDAARLIQGPAYGEPLAAAAGPNDWPTYRSDPNRSGRLRSVVPAELEDGWQTQLEGNLTAPVIANGKVFLASKDIHTVYALDESTGTQLWSFIASGRIDSPPSIYKGRVIFGSADGYVYCLRATDGALIWQFQAAPELIKMTSFEQVESVWPAHGSTLILNDSVYFVAGRSMFLDGGIRFLQLDPVTGSKMNEVILDDEDPNGSGKNLQVHIKGLNMPVALTDVLSSDGEYIYMKSQRFDLAGNREEIPPNTSNHGQDQYGLGVHLFSPTGLLDDYYMHRNYWVWGRKWASGAGGWYQAGKYAAAAGRIMAIGENHVYGYGRLTEYWKWSVPLEYHLFKAEKYPAAEDTTYTWSNENVPIMANAMALTDKILWLAGPQDHVNEEDAFDYWSMDPNDPNYDPNIPDKLIAQDNALKNLSGAKLRAVATWDGNSLAEYDLESLPVWDGMAAANGNLYIALQNGKVICLRGTNYPPTVDAGPDQIIFPMVAATLDATISDDGIPTTDPNDPNAPPVGISCTWSKVAGPGDVNFADPNIQNTTAEFSAHGQYTLRATASDGSAIYADDVTVNIFRPGDLDDDDDVDIDDIILFVNSWLNGDCNNQNDWCLGADQSATGSVEMSSYDVMAANWLAGAIPAKPSGFSATGDANNISLAWNANSESDLAGYNVYRSITPGSGRIQLNVSLLTEPNYIDLSASNIITYYYVVEAVDLHSLASPKSTEKSASQGPQPGVKLIAEKGVTYDPNSLKVTNWNDQANNNDASQTDEPNQPTYIASAINALPAINFDGSGQHLDVADSDQINKGGPWAAKTLFVVFKTSSDITSKQILWEQGGGSRGFNFYIDSNDLYVNGWNRKEAPIWDPTGFTASVTPNTTYVASIVMDAPDINDPNNNSCEGFVNGISIGIVTNISQMYAHSDNAALGHTEGNSRFISGGNKSIADLNGLIAEFYSFDDALSPADRTALENYLITKYGITP